MGLLRDYESSYGPSFQALVSSRGTVSGDKESFAEFKQREMEVKKNMKT